MLIVGLSGVGAEVCKNMILAGVNLTIYDRNLVKKEDILTNFYLRDSSIGKNKALECVERLRSLNPLVSVNILQEDISESNVKPFNLVCCCYLPDTSVKNYLVEMNVSCRNAGVSFLLVFSQGLNGMLFSDLGQSFTYTKKVQGKVQSFTEKFSSLDNIFSLELNSKNFPVSKRKRIPELVFALFKFCNVKVEKNDDLYNFERVLDLEKFLINQIELAPVCAILGGVAAQEAVKIISSKDTPINNFFVFDGMKSSGVVRKIGK